MNLLSIKKTLFVNIICHERERKISFGQLDLKFSADMPIFLTEVMT